MAKITAASTDGELPELGELGAEEHTILNEIYLGKLTAN